MTGKGTQLVYLTATMPPVLQPAFLDLAGLDSKELDVIRDETTTRPNIAYQVHEYARGELDVTLAQLVAAKRAQYGPEAQILIYCLSVAETKRLGKLLQCSAYYREMASDEEKAHMVRAFTAGAEKLCTTTTILSLGIHAPGVRVVIHVQMCKLLLDLVQESGRAGREGHASESIVLRACSVDRAQRVPWLGYHLEQRARAYLEETSCRCIVIDGYMDGREDRQYCEMGEVKCDLCARTTRGTKRLMENERPPAEATPDEKKRRELVQLRRVREQAVELVQRRKTEQTAYELERLERHLQRWVHACAICMAVESATEKHRWEACPAASEEQMAAMMASYQSLHRVKWAPYARCNYCWAPQAVCSKWVENPTTQGGYRSLGGRVACQFERILPQAVAALLAFQGAVCRPWLETQMQLARVMDGSVEERWCQWLGQKLQMGQRNASRMCSVLCAWEEGHMHRAR